MRATIENIREIVEQAEVLATLDELKNDIPLTHQGVDSLDMANIYLLSEEKFGIKIADEDIAKLQTINDIVEYVNNLK